MKIFLLCLFVGLCGALLFFANWEGPFHEIWWLNLIIICLIALSFFGILSLHKKRIQTLPHTFISYSHAADSLIAPHLRRHISQAKKPFFEMFARYAVFDRADLRLKPDAGKPELEAGLRSLIDKAKFFILLASPQAAQSDWVMFEVNTWVAKNGIHRLFILLTDGDIVWDDTAHNFNWDRTNSLPRCISEHFNTKPSYIDLRGKRSQIKKRKIGNGLRELMTPLLASIDGEDLKAFQRTDLRYRKIERHIAYFIITFIILQLVMLLFAFWFKYG